MLKTNKLITMADDQTWHIMIDDVSVATRAVPRAKKRRKLGSQVEYFKLKARSKKKNEFYSFILCKTFTIGVFTTTLKVQVQKEEEKIKSLRGSIRS